MFLKALLAFIALPGVVAFAIPAWWLWRTTGLRLAHSWGLAILLVGCTGLLWCVRDFYVAGRGTLAPWSPPQRLVVVGLYRFSRNPMYVSVLLVLLGWAAAFGSSGLVIYATGVAVAFHVRTVYGEEPWLAATHGEAWRQYAARVRRWF